MSDSGDKVRPGVQEPEKLSFMDKLKRFGKSAKEGAAESAKTGGAALKVVGSGLVGAGKGLARGIFKIPRAIANFPLNIRKLKRFVVQNADNQKDDRFCSFISRANNDPTMYGECIDTFIHNRYAQKCYEVQKDPKMKEDEKKRKCKKYRWQYLMESAAMTRMPTRYPTPFEWYGLDDNQVIFYNPDTYEDGTGAGSVDNAPRISFMDDARGGKSDEQYKNAKDMHIAKFGPNSDPDEFDYEIFKEKNRKVMGSKDSDATATDNLDATDAKYQQAFQTEAEYAFLADEYLQAQYAAQHAETAQEQIYYLMYSAHMADLADNIMEQLYETDLYDEDENKFTQYAAEYCEEASESSNNQGPLL